MHGVFFGTGQFASIQLDAWSRVSGARIAAVHGNAGRAERLAGQFSIPQHGSDARELIARTQPEFADICTALEKHAESIRLCADLALPILCQKPLAESLQDARDCVDYCAAAGVRLMVHDNWRWQPWYREIKRLLASGAVGQPLSVYHTLRTGDGLGPLPYPAQPYFRSMPRFLLLETTIHYLDTYRFLFGEPEQIACVTHRNNPAIAGEDQAVVTLRFRNGPVVIWDGNRAVPSAHRKPPFNGEMRIEGTGGVLEVDPFGRMQLTGPSGDTQPHTYDIPDGYRGGSVQATLLHFITCLQRGTAFETEGADYLKTMELVFLAYEAAATGRTLQVAT